MKYRKRKQFYHRVSLINLTTKSKQIYTYDGELREIYIYTPKGRLAGKEKKHANRKSQVFGAVYKFSCLLI